MHIKIAVETNKCADVRNNKEHNYFYYWKGT